MGAVDLLVVIQEAFAKQGVVLNSCKAPPLRLNFANGSEDVSTSLFPVPFMMFNMVLKFRLLNAPGPCLLGEDAHETLKLVVDHETGQVYSKVLNKSINAERLEPSRHLAIDVCDPKWLELLDDAATRDRLIRGLEATQGSHDNYAADSVSKSTQSTYQSSR